MKENDVVDPQPPFHRLVLVSGPSGAGRSTAIHALEDMGFEAIDNLPLSLVPRLLDGPPLGRPLALGVDIRNRDFSVTALMDMLTMLTDNGSVHSQLLYLDTREEVLIRRYSETRRRHPLAPDETPRDGILREIDLLVPIRARADVLIDTSDLSPHDLRAELETWFSESGAAQMAVSVQSFSYKRGMPRGVDMVFDCRFLANPYWEKDLRSFDGRDAEVAAFIKTDDRFADFFERVQDMSEFLLPAYREEGKSHLAIGFGCTGGQHRSVAVAEMLGTALANKGWQVSIRHRELERRARGAEAVQQGA